MATYDLTANAKTVYGTVNTNDISILNKIQNLENKVSSQSEKLDHIVNLLNELSEKKSTS